MAILEPSTTPTNHQVWPPSADTPHGRWLAGSSVTLDGIQVGDTIVFWNEGRTLTDRPAVKEGRVEKIRVTNGRRSLVWVATKRGMCVLTDKNWAERAPRR